MRYLVISDIHANLEALEAVLAASGACERVLVLGDLVGYGADPNPVVDRIRALAAVTIVRGNHDKVGAGLEDVEGFNYLARQAIAWTAAALTPDNRAWLAALPQGPTRVDPLVEICHGSPFDEDTYIFDDLDATRALRAARAPLCLFGHTHVPAAYRLGAPDPRAETRSARDEGEMRMIGPPRGARFRLALDADARYLVNCGAVGQPRDGDPHAAFGLFDTDERSLTVLRVPYDVAAAQAKIIAAGLPEVLAQRLAVGR
jgi:diadenosine tetraphosphatase ApaH/serine/threonine PP2A family protein phosphatase